HLKRPGPILQRLRQLSIGNVAVGDKDQRLEAPCAGVGCHRRRRVSGGHASYPPHGEPPRMRDPAGHPIVFKRTSRIEALMLERNMIKPAIARGARTAQQRRISLAQRYDVAVVLDKWEELPIAPHARLIE